MPQVRFLPSWYFNSQPHKEADMCFGIPQGGDEISTHSLTRRLTQLDRPLDTITTISTHSLTRRLTMHRIVRNMHQAHFNSQPHKEADFSSSQDVPPVLSFQLTASQGG